jgi:hypothetical protein
LSRQARGTASRTRSPRRLSHGDPDAAVATIDGLIDELSRRTRQ